MKNFRIIFFFAVMLVSAITSQWLIRYQVSQRDVLFSQINMSGRQRMLSQAMVKNAYRLQLTPWQERGTIEAVQAQLLEMVRQFEEAQSQLASNQHNDANIKEAFEAMVQAAQPLLRATKAIGTAQDSATMVGSAAGIGEIQQEFLVRMEDTVQAFEDYGKATLEQITQWETISSIVTYLVLLVAFFLVVRPMISRIEESNRTINSQRGQYSATQAAIEQVTSELHHLNEALERCWDQTKKFVEHAPGTMALLDTHMKYLAASASWYVNHDLVGQNILGNSHYEMIPNQPEEWKEIHSKCLAGEISRKHDVHYIDNDGKQHCVSWDIRPWYDGHGKVGGLTMMLVNHPMD